MTTLPMPLDLEGIRYRGARPSQYTAATIRQDYADLLAALQRATDRAANFAQAYDSVLSSAAAEAREAEQIGRRSAEADLQQRDAEIARLTAASTGPCPVGDAECDVESHDTLNDHLYCEHEAEDLVAALVRMALANDRLRVELQQARDPG